MPTPVSSYIRLALCAGVSAFALGLTAGQACASEAAATDAADASVEELVVTAQQREQKLIDVPVPVTSLSGEVLDRFKIQGLGDLSLYTPGLLVQEQSVQRSGYNLRGLTQDDSSPVAEPVISIFVDGVDNSRQQGSISELIDIARAEVVRGPQGTLFGRGSVIGVMSIETRRPTQGFEGWVSAEAGSLNLRSLSGMVNAPLIKDKLAFRVTARVKSRDGDVDNVAIPGGKLNGVDTFYGRASLRFTPNEMVTSDLIASYQEDHPPATQFKSIVVAPAGGDVSPFTPAAQDRPDQGIERYVSSLTSDTSIAATPTLTLRSIANIRYVDATEKWDGDGTAYSYIIGNQFTKQHQASEELRATWTPSEDLTLVGGASWFREKVEDRIELGLNEQYLVGSFPSITAPTKAIYANTSLYGLPVSAMNMSSLYRINTRTSVSAYLNVSKTFLERITLEAGLRYTHDKADTAASADEYTLDGRRPLALPYGLFGDSQGNVYSHGSTFNNLTPRLAVSYKLTPKVNVFIGVAKGVRSGLVDASFNRSTGAPDAIWSVVRPEKVVNVEAGFKANVGAFLAEGSAFSYDYTDFQTLDLSQLPGKLVNAGKASGKGFELGLRGAITDNLRLISSYAYTDAKFDEYIDSSGADLSGNVFRLAPKHKASIALSYERDVGQDLRLAARVTEFYQSKTFFNADNKPYESQKGYALTNVGLSLGSVSRGWSAEIYANNLFDKDYLLDLGNTGKSFGLPTAIRGEPRIVGLRLRQDW
ncbi:TonB-dependent receptor [Phenylobacterium sp.]|uniref:TonB-dependent receptor n=1 Tax=Phenylobacterium sp. TaxID=1871053 RepID=UPI0035B40FD9